MTLATTTLDRLSWPKPKVYDVIMTGPNEADIVPKQESTPQELEGVAASLMVDMIAFFQAGRKLS